MHTQTRKTIPFVFLLAALLMTTMACSMGGLAVNKDSATLTISLKEDQVNKILERANTTVNTNFSQYRLLDEITLVKMQSGLMTINGIRKQDDGSQVNGSFSITMSAVDGALKVAIQDVNIPGVDATNESIASVNKIIEDEMTKSVKEANGEVVFQEATIADGKLTLKVKVNFKK